jgi:DNA-binding transcriptional regulator LsrR (DeoR family)
MDERFHDFLYKIASAYYQDDLTQLQIGSRFGISRMKVSRLLKQARKEGIVTISLKLPTNRLTEWEHQLEQHYHLKEAAVVYVEDTRDAISVARSLAPVTAKLLLRRITGNETIAITWGTTMNHVVHALPYQDYPNMTVVQMNGGLGPVENFEHAIELTTLTAKRFNAKLKLLPAPGIVKDRHTARIFMENNQIAESLELAAASDIAVVGIGALSSASVLMREGTILTKDEFSDLKQKGAVGDIVLRYFDKKGNMLDLEVNQRIVGINIDQVKHISQVIAVAGGEVKFEAIHAALMGKLFNILVTDHKTAQKLLQH